jgi:SAM-dependent methyltransferase
VRGYQRDLAFIHDAGYSDYALRAAPGLLKILKGHIANGGQVVDLGCGSGRWARELNRSGYRVLGVDQSPAMIRLARRIAPKSRFKIASLLCVDFPHCDAITSIGECINYRFDRPNNRRTLMSLFKRVHRVLEPGGVFICDFATPEGKPPGGVREHQREGRGWRLMARTTTRGARRIRREIVVFRKIGGRWRHSEEIHDLWLYSSPEICRDLKRYGFRVQAVRGYGRFRFPMGIEGVIAVKPMPRAN